VIERVPGEEWPHIRGDIFFVFQVGDFSIVEVE
jgi:hypothetical protein